MITNYKPQGVCSRMITLDTENDVINRIEFLGGCAGNSQGVAALVKGRRIDEVITMLKGINCNGKGTSCPDQLTLALEEIKAKTEQK